MLASLMTTAKERVPGRSRLQGPGPGTLRARERQTRLWSKATQISTHSEPDAGAGDLSLGWRMIAFR